MKYKGQKIRKDVVSDSVSGMEKEYDCYFFDTRYLMDLTDIKNVICISANSIPQSEGNIITSFIRKYVEIEYYEDFEEYKKKIIGSFLPMSVFVIPCDGLAETKIHEIVTDIKTKHNMGYSK